MPLGPRAARDADGEIPRRRGLQRDDAVPREFARADDEPVTEGLEKAETVGAIVEAIFGFFRG